MNSTTLPHSLRALDEVQGIAFEGMFSMEVQKKVNANGGIITMQDMRDLAVSARADCYHVVDAADDAALGRFYAETILFQSWMECRILYLRCWTSPVSEE